MRRGLASVDEILTALETPRPGLMARKTEPMTEPAAPPDPPIDARSREFRRAVPEAFRAAVLSAELEAIVGRAAYRAAVGWSGRLLVLRGPTAAGKTTLAAALLRRAIEEGAIGARFVSSRELDPSPRGAEAWTVLDRVHSAPYLVIDGIGEELRGDLSTGWASARRPVVMELLERRHDFGQKVRTVVTLDGGLFGQTSLSEARLKFVQAYTEAIERRVFRTDPVLGDPLVIHCRGAA